MLPGRNMHVDFGTATEVMRIIEAVSETWVGKCDCRLHLPS